MKTALLPFAALLLVTSAYAKEYTIDADHSSVNFSVKHLMVSKVNGHFDKFSGSINYEPNKPKEWSTKVTIEAASINTANTKRDDHLRSPDFLDASKFPTITFESKEVTNVKGKSCKVKGILTLHGVAKEVTLDTEIGGMAKDPWGNNRVAFSGKTRINRGDYGLKWNKALEAGGVLVGDEVDISLEVEAIEKK